MKLFIYNRYEMEDELKEFKIDPKNFHTIVYHKLLNSIEIEDCIPLTLSAKFNDDDIVILNLTSINKSNDIYYYNFKGVI